MELAVPNGGELARLECFVQRFRVAPSVRKELTVAGAKRTTWHVVFLRVERGRRLCFGLIWREENQCKSDLSPWR
jgi:hypothetical protein